MNSTLETTFLWCKIGWIFTWTCFLNEMIGRFWVIWVLKLVKIEPIFFKILENLKSIFSDAIRPPEHFWIYGHALKNAYKWPKIAFEKRMFLLFLICLAKIMDLLVKLCQLRWNWKELHFWPFLTIKIN